MHTVYARTNGPMQTLGLSILSVIHMFFTIEQLLTASPNLFRIDSLLGCSALLKTTHCRHAWYCPEDETVVYILENEVSFSTTLKNELTVQYPSSNVKPIKRIGPSTKEAKFHSCRIEGRFVSTTTTASKINVFSGVCSFVTV